MDQACQTTSAMHLEDERTLYQFAQGIQPLADLRGRFSQLDTGKQRKRFVYFYGRVRDYEFEEADIEQALADCGLNTSDALYEYLNLHQLATGSTNVVCIPHTANPPGGTLDKAYTVLQHLYKTGYYRRFVSEKTDPADWMYQDLSDHAFVRELLTSHQALLDKIYENPRFRSEFVCLAKLWYAEHLLAEKADHREQKPPETQTNFHFVTYDELVTEKALATNKSWDAIGLLVNSVAKGLSIQYGLDLDKARNVMFAVIDKHAQETYYTELFE